MSDERFRATIPPRAWGGKRVMVVGVGGIGSYVVPPLVRMGCRNVALVDFDNVEEANVGTQDVYEGSVGLAKVHAVGDRARALNMDVEVRTWGEAWKVGMLEDYDPHVLILSVDSIEVREEIVNATLMSDTASPSLELVVDPRMGFEALEVYTWTPKDHRRDEQAYLDTLKEREHRAVVCGASAIAYTGQYAGSVVASVVRRWLCGKNVPKIILGDIGSYEMSVTWGVNERYTECT